MPRLAPSTSRVALPLAGGLVAVGLVASLVACLTDPPPDLVLPAQPPSIVHDAIQPPEGLITELPAFDQYIVPIQIPNPSAACQYELYVDKALVQATSCQETAIANGIATQVVTPPQELDPTTCHVITFQLGTDSATWRYVPASCEVYDAGPFQGGAFPDAAADGLPVVVGESGADQ
jgi:hypothetical protein